MPSEKTYLGRIVDIKDPLYQGRARINVFGIFDDIPTEDLPWAEQNAGLAFGSDHGGGNISIPRLDAVVSVHFEIENYLFFGIYLDDGFVLNIHRSSRKIKCRYRLIPITLRRTNASNKQCS